MQFTGSIDRRATISKDEFDADYLLKKPLLLTGMTDGWRARSWSPAYFRDTFGDTDVFVEMGYSIEGAGNGAGSVEIRRRRVRFGEYIDEVTGGRKDCGYISVYPVMEQFPKLRFHVDFPKFGWAESERWTDFFFGPPKTLAPLHYDTMENLFCQVYGRKEFTVISPEFRRGCYPTKETWMDGYSFVDVKAPDYERFPEFREVIGTRVVLDPGDLLYVPSGWWHTVRALDVSISVNEWFLTREFAEKYADKLADPSERGGYEYPIDDSLIRHCE